MLLDCGFVDRRVKVFRGDGGIDGLKGSLAQGSELVIYQGKYFPKPWGDSQKKQIRESFAAVRKGLRLKEWFLCTPSRATKEDQRWFDTWRKKQAPTPIELIDGDKLISMLNQPCASRA
jgi:restriction endonuclease Mrr